MTDPAKLPRPRQVTLAAWLIIGGSLLVVVSVFERVAGLNGLETQEAIEEFLATPPGSGLGLDVQGALTAIRAVSMVAAGCAAAAAILGYHLLRGNRGARWGITLLALPLFLSGLVAGGFLSSLVAASAVMLWLEPSRDWFNGKPAQAPPERHRRSPEQVTAAAPPSEPRPHPGFGAAPAGPAAAQAPGGSPAPHPGVWAPPPRPDAVLWACLLTWVFSGLAALAMAALGLVVLASPEVFFDQLRSQDPALARDLPSDATLARAIYAIAGMTVVWSAVATTLAVLLYRRVTWARPALVVCVAGAGAVCLLAAVGSLLLVLPLLGCGATIALLLRREVRAWATTP